MHILEPRRGSANANLTPDLSAAGGVHRLPCQVNSETPAIDTYKKSLVWRLHPTTRNNMYALKVFAAAIALFAVQASAQTPIVTCENNMILFPLSSRS